MLYEVIKFVLLVLVENHRWGIRRCELDLCLAREGVLLQLGQIALQLLEGVRVHSLQEFLDSLELGGPGCACGGAGVFEASGVEVTKVNTG